MSLSVLSDHFPLLRHPWLSPPAWALPRFNAACSVGRWLRHRGEGRAVCVCVCVCVCAVTNKSLPAEVTLSWRLPHKSMFVNNLCVTCQQRCHTQIFIIAFQILSSGRPWQNEAKLRLTLSRINGGTRIFRPLSRLIASLLNDTGLHNQANRIMLSSYGKQTTVKWTPDGWYHK